MKNTHKLVTRTALSILLSLSVTSVTMAASSLQFKDVPERHWSYASINWAVDNGLAMGDEQGNFRPAAAITESEFLAMLMRMYKDELTLPPADPAQPWYAPYYEAAYALGWPASYGGSASPYSRGEAAVLIAYAASGELADVPSAINYLLNHGLANGKTSNTVEGFGASHTITRAEAVTLLKNLKDNSPSLATVKSESNAPSESSTTSKALTLSGISLGAEETAVISKLGQPDRKDPSQYGFTWYIYNKNYARYAQIGVHNNKVVALYSNASGVWSSDNGIRNGITSDELSKLTGDQIGSSGKLYTISTDSEDTTYYFDRFNDQKLDAILILDRLAHIDEVQTASGGEQDKLARAMERQIFDLTNVFRQKNNIKLLQWDDLIATTARKHSQDMSDRQYFEHSNPDGKSPFDRMKADGITFSRAAENIASGYSNAMEGHNGWLNSWGHRNNLLDDRLQRLGVGVFEGYYTQNFYTPK